MIVSYNIQRVDFFVSGDLSKGQAQAETNCLHCENIDLGSIKRNDCKQIIDIPALFQFVDMQHDFSCVSGVLNREKTTDILLAFFAFHVGVNLNNLPFISATEETVAVNKSPDSLGMIGILTGDQHNRLDIR